MKKWLRGGALVGLLAIPMVVSGCGLFSKSASEPIDPPQTEVIEGQEEQTNSWFDSTVEGATQYTVYLQDSNGYLAPITLPMAIAEGEQVATKVLEVMVDQGLFATALPADFRALIPQGTEVLSYEFNTETGVATVNFSESFVDYNAADERAIVEAITWTLTSLEGVQAVAIQVDGVQLEEMPVASYPLAAATTRDIGINIEIAEGVSYSHASPVTIYFSAKSASEESYYVPITRMINRTGDSQAVAAIEQLIAGPQNTKALIPVMFPNVEVTSIEEYDGVVHVDLEDEAYEPGLFVPSELLTAVILSVSENTDAESVQVRMNGDINIVDENNTSYSAPVSIPTNVNALKL